MTAVCSAVAPDILAPADTARPEDMPMSAVAPESAPPVPAPAPDSDRVPLPTPLLNIWESFVLDQAQRGRTEVHYMVPVLITMLSERGVASMRPDDKRRARLERWRAALQTELGKIAQAKVQGNNGLQDGFRPLAVAESMPLDATGNDTNNAVAYASILLFTQSELEVHRRAVNAHVAPTTAALKELNQQEEAMVRQRLQLMQRLSTYSSDLLATGHEVVRKFQASELERIAVGAHAEAEVDAALASLMPPPVQVTYRIVFSTLWRMVEQALGRLMALEPPALKAWRQRVLAARR